MASSSTPQGKAKMPIHQTSSKVKKRCYDRFLRDQAANRGPSSERIKKLMNKSGREPHKVLGLAESGDAVAAFVVGFAFGERRAVKACYDRGEAGKYFIPKNYLEKSFLETDEIAIKWLKVAAEGGLPEGMFLLCVKILDYESGVDKRVGHYWLTEAHRTGKMDYLMEYLERSLMGIPLELEDMSWMLAGVENGRITMEGPTLSHLLLATRWLQIKEWAGKTAIGEPFFGRAHFRAIMETVGELEKIDDSHPYLAFSQKKSVTLLFISGRPGSIDIVRKAVARERDENNVKFMQGVKAEVYPDFQLVIQTMENGLVSYVKNRTPYFVSCKHTPSRIERGKEIKSAPGLVLMKDEGNFKDGFNYKLAGKCQPCSSDAFQRLRAVAFGQYSMSLGETIPDYGYAARYIDENGIIVQDIFKAYCKPELRQILQCLMTNPADLHPYAVAEDQNLYWPIIWYWGSVFSAVQDTCDEFTLQTIYAKLGRKVIFKTAGSSGLEAFPEASAGEWRIACGNEECPMVDHKVKFNMCKGCKVRRYCNEVCQRKDWAKHKGFCKAGQKGASQA